MSRTSTARINFLIYLAFVVYGSLVPLDVRSLSLAEAIARFQQIPWLELDAGSRADWIANLVLYVPLALLACAWLAPSSKPTAVRTVWIVTVALLCMATAVGVEFAQVYFEPRTVSLNDLLAESLGTLLGCAVWALGHDRLSTLWQAIHGGGRASLAAAIVGYLLIYLLLSLFPYDFVISWAELEAKADGAHYGWLATGDGLGSLRVWAGLIIEGLAIAPLGTLAGLLLRRAPLSRAFALGVVLGVVLEAVQFLLVSGTSQGASVLVRGAGLAAGVWLGQRLRGVDLLPLARGITRAIPALALPYVIALVAAAGWFSHPVGSLIDARDQWAQLRLIPFYYHYFTSEPVAVSSLLANLALYAPLGVAAWARHAVSPLARRRGAREPAALAVLFVLPIETSKLWLGGTHPDFTNVLIGAMGAVLTYWAAGWSTRILTLDDSPESGTSRQPQATREPQPSRPRRQFRLTPPPVPWLLASIATCTVILVGLWRYPVAAPLLTAGLIGYAVALWRWPLAWLLVIPAALPVLDFAPYTGMLALDALDLVVLTTLAVACWRVLPQPARTWPSRGWAVAFGLLAASATIAIAIGLAGGVERGTATLAASHSPLDAWTIGKGLIWALCLVPLLRRVPAEQAPHALRRLIEGLSLGVALLGLTVLWERWVYVGIVDFADVFRVTGNFSAMRTGGAYIEAYIALALPALVVWTLEQRRRLLWLAGIAFIALASHAMLVTFSRGGYAGMLAGLAAVAFAVRRGRRAPGLRAPLRTLAVLVAVAGAATPVLLGSFAQDRLARIQQDLEVRLDHWARAIDIMEPGPITTLLGMGMGQYPTAYLWRAQVADPPGSFAVRGEGDAAYLQLGSGDAYYVDQVVAVQPGPVYRVGVRARFRGPVAQLNIGLCEKALLYSFQCRWSNLKRPPELADGDWQVIEAPLATAGLAATGRWPAPTLKLSIAGPHQPGVIDIDTIGLAGPDGRQWLANGDFSRGLDHWLSSTDRDLAWHIHQTPLEVFFAQGLLGLAAIGLLAWVAARTLLTAIREGDDFAIAIGGGLVGFVTVGLLGSTLDAARLSLAFYLVALAAMACAKAPWQRQGQPGNAGDPARHGDSVLPPA